MNEKPAVGIMGGTFDPIHYGHLAVAEEARFRFALEKIIFIPCGLPPHKKNYKVNEPRHRLEMTRLAIQDNPSFEVSRIEIDRPGSSYSVDTVAQLRRSHPEVGSFFFITGADAVLEILTWKEPQRLVDECQLVAASRPGYDLAKFKAEVGEELAEKIKTLSMPGVNISSTEIRQRTATAAPIRYLVPENVRAYIEQQGLYR